MDKRLEGCKLKYIKTAKKFGEALEKNDEQACLNYHVFMDEILMDLYDEGEEYWLDEFRTLLVNKDKCVRFCCAVDLLKFCEKESVKVLKELRNDCWFGKECEMLLPDYE